MLPREDVTHPFSDRLALTWLRNNALIGTGLQRRVAVSPCENRARVEYETNLAVFLVTFERGYPTRMRALGEL